MPTENLVCWKCGASLDEVPKPISRYAECLTCRVELHVCRLCRFYDTSVAQDCREPMADEVKDKTRANFCEFFEPRADAFAADSSAGDTGNTDALNALFGAAGEAEPGARESSDPHRQALDDLFGEGTRSKD